MLFGHQEAVAGKHPSPLGVRLGERHDGLAVVDPSVTDATRSTAVRLAMRNALSPPLRRVDFRRDVLPGDRGAVAPDRLGIDGVGDHLRVGAGQCDVGEVVGVDVAVPSAAMTNARGIVGRMMGKTESPVLPSMFSTLKFSGKLASGSRRSPPSRRRGGVLRVDVAGGADLGGAPRRWRRLITAGTAR